MSNHSWMKSWALGLLTATCSSLGCADDEGAHDHGHDAALADAAPVDAGPQSVTLSFAAKINGQAFACGTTYQGVGTPAASYTPTDFRFYVHDVRLVDGTGGEVPVTLSQDGAFQKDALALLDFETGDKGCDMGTAATHVALTGSVPSGTYTGVKFVLGVPATMNHIDQATAPAPLNDSTMWWVWRAGFKYFKVDGTGGAGATPFAFHLGATGCPGASPTEPPSGPCTAPNLVEVSLGGFDPASKVIVADFGKVLANVDVTKNTTATAPGCMSAPDDPECVPIFGKLGLPIGPSPGGTQVLFSVE